MEHAWTIAELATEAAAVLAGAGPAGDGRISDRPGERLIRWYTTIGLLDPPLARRGRTATYGRRHLLQLVAVKRRQAAGRTIAQIQAELTGASDEVLAAAAALPAEGDRFWTRRPAPPALPEVRPVHGLALAPGVTLLVEGGPVGGAELAALAEAARPLLDELTRHGRIGPPNTPQGDRS